MKQIAWLAMVAILLAIIGIPPAFAQISLATGTAGQTSWLSGIYSPSATGNQDRAREFDGRNFGLWGIEQLDSYGYGGPYQYWFGTRDLILGDESVVFDLGYLNDLELTLSTDALTHRLSITPYERVTVGSFHGGINPYLAGIIYTPAVGSPSPLSGINATTGVPFGDAYRDYTPDTNFALDRRVNAFTLRHFLGSEGRVAVRGGMWTEKEDGPQQILFYDSPGTTRARSASAMNVNRKTMNGTMGVDLQVGKQSVINYSAINTSFSDSTKPATPGFQALDSIHIPNVNTTSSIVKARSRITNRLFFTGVQTNRSRKNETARVYPSGSGFLDGRIKTSATNLSLTFLANDALTFTGRYRKYDLNNFVPAVFETGKTDPANNALSRSTSSLDLGGSYTGIKNAFLKLGFERRDSDREEGSVHGGELSDEMISPSTRSNIWRLSARYYPTLALGLAGSAENWKTDHPAFFGTPTDSTRTNLNATYVIRDNFTLYGDYSRWHDKNSEIRVADVPGIFNPVTHLNDPALAELAAGQGYVNTFTNMNFGAWYGITPKLTFDADIASIKTEASAWWIIGDDPTYGPHLQPDFVPYTTKNNQWSMGLTYALRPTIQVYGRFLNSTFDGRSNFTALPGVVLPDGWTPIAGSEKVWTLGFAHDLSEKDRILLDFSVSDWKDKLNPGQNGRFNVWRLAWATTY